MNWWPLLVLAYAAGFVTVPAYFVLDARLHKRRYRRAQEAE